MVIGENRRFNETNTVTVTRFVARYLHKAHWVTLLFREELLVRRINYLNGKLRDKISS